jgi:hypothetical protein
MEGTTLTVPPVGERFHLTCRSQINIAQAACGLVSVSRDLFLLTPATPNEATSTRSIHQISCLYSVVHSRDSIKSSRLAWENGYPSPPPPDPHAGFGSGVLEMGVVLMARELGLGIIFMRGVVFLCLRVIDSVTLPRKIIFSIMSFPKIYRNTDSCTISPPLIPLIPLIPCEKTPWET